MQLKSTNSTPIRLRMERWIGICKRVFYDFRSSRQQDTAGKLHMWLLDSFLQSVTAIKQSGRPSPIMAMPRYHYDKRPLLSAV